MPKIDIPSLVQRLPQNVRDHLFDDTLTEKYEEIFETDDITDEQAEKARNLVWRIYAKDISLPEFLSSLEKETGLPKEASKKIAIQIIGWDFLPVADFLGVDVAGYLKEIGADPHIFVQYANPAEVARDLAEQISARSARGAQGASGTDATSADKEERLRRRLEDIILNRLNNVRDDLETKNVLTRGMKLGGLELDEANAAAVLALIKVELDSLIKKRVVLGEEKQAIIEAKPQLKIEVKPRPKLEIAMPRPAVAARDDDKGVVAISSPVIARPKAGVISTPPPPRSTPPRPNFVTQNLGRQASPPVTPPNLPLVEEAEKAGGLQQAQPVIVLPQPEIATPRLGGTRDDQEMFEAKPRYEVLLPKIKPGDILAPDEASEVKALVGKTPKPQFNADGIIKNSLTRIQEEAAIKFNDPLIASRFAAALSNRLKDIRDSVETKDLLMRVVNLGGVGLAQEAADKAIKILDNEFSRVHEDLRATKETEIRAVTQKRQEASEMKKVEIEKKEKDELESRFKKLFIRSETPHQMLRDGTGQASRGGKRESPHQTFHNGAGQAKREKKPTSTDLPLERGEDRRGGEVLPSLAAPPPTSRGRIEEGVQPSLEDVKYTPRLVGPLEELKNFSLDDLRKLSVRPKDASRRLLDKLEVLRGEAMEKKIVGIGAFKASPLWQSYVEVINKALQVGQSPKDIIAARLAVDKGAINQDEFDAIIGLSENLRY